MKVAVVMIVAQTEARLEIMFMIEQLCFEVLQVANNTAIAAVFVFLSPAWVVSVVADVIAAVGAVCITAVTHASLSIHAAHSTPLTIEADDAIAEFLHLGLSYREECWT